MKNFLFNCPHCQGQISGNESIMGQKHNCIYCHKELVVPGKQYPQSLILGLCISIVALIIFSLAGWLKNQKVKEVEVEVIKEVEVSSKNFIYNVTQLKEDRAEVIKFEKYMKNWLNNSDINTDVTATRRNMYIIMKQFYAKFKEMALKSPPKFHNPKLIIDAHDAMQNALYNSMIQTLLVGLSISDDDITLDFRNKDLVQDRKIPLDVLYLNLLSMKYAVKISN